MPLALGDELRGKKPRQAPKDTVFSITPEELRLRYRSLSTLFIFGSTVGMSSSFFRRTGNDSEMSNAVLALKVVIERALRGAGFFTISSTVVLS